MNKIKFFIVLTSIVLGSSAAFGSDKAASTKSNISEKVRGCYYYFVYLIHNDPNSFFNAFNGNEYKNLIADYVDEKTGDTLLFQALMKRQHLIAKILLDAGARVNFHLKHNGMTPLICACDNDDLDSAKLLIEHKANVNLACNNLTPLMRTTLMNSPSMVELLLQNKANIDAQTSDDGMTALMFAVDVNSPQLMELLARHNPNPAICSHLLCKDGLVINYTAYQWAQQALQSGDLNNNKHSARLCRFKRAENNKKILNILYQLSLQKNTSQQSSTQQAGPKVMSWTTTDSAKKKNTEDSQPTTTSTTTSTKSSHQTLLPTKSLLKDHLSEDAQKEKTPSQQRRYERRSQMRIANKVLDVTENTTDSTTATGKEKDITRDEAAKQRAKQLQRLNRDHRRLASSCLQVLTKQQGTDKKNNEGSEIITPTEDDLKKVIGDLRENRISNEDFITLFSCKKNSWIRLDENRCLRIGRTELLNQMRKAAIITIDEKDINGPLTPLMIACAMKEENASLVDSVILERALAQGNLEAILNARSATGKRAYNFAQANGHAKILKVLDAAEKALFEEAREAVRKAAPHLDAAEEALFEEAREAVRKAAQNKNSTCKKRE